MRCLELTGSDERMDCRDLFDAPVNPLPQKCLSCGFPDLDHVPQPYLLVQSRTASPKEMAPAQQGNFLVRPRVRRVLELIVPGQCRFYRTVSNKTHESTPWQLVVPSHQVKTATVAASIPRCAACGEPRSAHPGSQYDQWVWNRESSHHLLKSATWGSSEEGWDRWVSRELFMSIRLFHLLKKIKAKGLDEATCGHRTRPDAEEAAWIREKLDLLTSSGIPCQVDGTLPDDDLKWLRDYIKSRSRSRASPVDVRTAGKRLKLKLPKSYIEFVTKVGPAVFEDVDEQEGFNVRLLTPDEFDTETYRAGMLDAEDPETDAVDGVMFAATEHGDCFCFDVREDNTEFPVYVYKHEYNCFELYAGNFAACVRRFARETHS